ncbi:MAG: hypothetical protein HRU03_08185, partial [Nanoarchaeales archaeon]|nr:hypothetical protein [Nanoarchaeales archaeon]
NTITNKTNNIYENINFKNTLDDSNSTTNSITNTDTAVQSFNLAEKLKSDHNVLLLKLELDKLNRSGLTWTELYIYLKNQNISNLQMKYLFTFDNLIKQIKKFCNKNKADFSIQSKIRKQSWITDCFFYEKPSEQIVRDISFMISGVNIYGFDEKRFQEFFIEEMQTGATHTTLSQHQKEYLDKEFEKLFKYE